MLQSRVVPSGMHLSRSDTVESSMGMQCCSQAVSVLQSGLCYPVRRRKVCKRSDNGSIVQLQFFFLLFCLLTTLWAYALCLKGGARIVVTG